MISAEIKKFAASQQINEVSKREQKTGLIFMSIIIYFVNDLKNLISNLISPDFPNLNCPVLKVLINRVPCLWCFV
jgi:hypothetical protein